MQKMSITTQVEANKTKTILIMAFFSLFIAMVSFVLSRASGYGISYAGIALIISGIMSLGSYYWSDKLVLRMSGAKPADRLRDPDLFTIIENIVRTASLPKPKIYVIEESATNAFATGRDPQHASICVTRGLLEKLERKELEGVLAHEISHIRNFDTRLMAIVSILVGTVAFLSDWFMRSLWWGGRNRERDEKGSLDAVFFLLGIFFALLSPLIATLIQLAVSRKREFLADASGALLTQNPEGLAGALGKIAQDKNVLPQATHATAHLFIENPFKEKNAGNWFSHLFNTHPPVEERIKILRSM